MDRRRKRRNNAAELDKDHVEKKKIAEIINERYGKLKSGSEVEAVINRSTGAVKNPSAYEGVVKRVMDPHFNRLLRVSNDVPDEPADLMSGVDWVCCLCGRRSCADSLGDLYGPYFARFDDGDVGLPNFLAPSTYTAQKSAAPARRLTKKECIGFSLEVWFHGKCAVWAPDIFFLSGSLPALERFLPAYWKQKCTRCKEHGATITSTDGKPLHYPCALEAGCYQLNELIFSCSPK